MADKPFRIVIAVAYEAIVEGETEADVRDLLANGDDQDLSSILENAVPLMSTLGEHYNEDTTVVEPATEDDQERILGEADPNIEGALDENGDDADPDGDPDVDQDHEDGDGDD